MDAFCGLPPDPSMLPNGITKLDFLYCFCAESGVDELQSKQSKTAEQLQVTGEQSISSSADQNRQNEKRDNVGIYGVHDGENENK